MLVLFLACTSQKPPTPLAPTLGETTRVVPDQLGFTTQDSNNNLDVLDFDGRTFLVFRTAPTHFAARETELVVVSTANEGPEAEWRYEGRFALGTDLRECRLLELNGQLHLYFAVLGDDPGAFEPQGMMHSVYTGPEVWTEPEYFYGEGYIPWRSRTDAKLGASLITYIGGENIYEMDAEPIRIEWLTSADGVSWTPMTESAVVSEGGGSETDYAWATDGRLVSVIRNEAGDAEFGWGSKVCVAPADDIGAWSCVADPKKYDSPLMFSFDDRVWLIGRRNLTDTGHYDLDRRDLSDAEQTAYYQVSYWQEPKRCALWTVDPDTQVVTWVLDFPSVGDTCFPAIRSIDNTRFAVYNYSNAIDGEDYTWVEGQMQPSYVYRTELLFE